MGDARTTIGCVLILFGAQRFPRLYRWLRLNDDRYEPEIW